MIFGKPQFIEELGAKCLSEYQREFGLIFNGIPKDNEGQKLVMSFLEEFEPALEAINERMTQLIQKINPDLLEAWAGRVQECVLCLSTLKEQLTFTGTLKWSWSDVTPAMVFLQAVRYQAETILGNHSIDIE